MRDFVGNKTAITYLKNSLSGDSLSHAYLFCGPESVGKTLAGVGFARQILCEGENSAKCNSCPSCKLFEKGNHPDFYQIDKETVLIDEIRELTESLDLKPFRGKAKVALVSHAEGLTTQALNSLLKTLEEPTAHTVIILTTENKKNLLETIVSRARVVNFGLVSDKEIYSHLNSELGVKRNDAERIVSLAGGRIGYAIKLANETSITGEVVDFANEFLRTYRSKDVYEKINLADKMSKDKEAIAQKLQNLELFVRHELVKLSQEQTAKSKVNDYINLLDRLVKSDQMIRANANAKLVIEGLLLGSI